MKVFRCNICGDPYIGAEKPTHCPFCGAHEDYIVLAKDWRDRNDVDLSEVSANNLREALQLEVNNSEFYKRAFMAAKDPYFQALFKALSKIEAEHASTIVKILKVQKPGVNQDIPNLASEKEYLAMAHEREIKAVTFYQKAADEACEPRVKELFTALVEIESDHIKLSE